MEISKATQPGGAVVGAQLNSSEQVDEKSGALNNSLLMQKDFQLTLQDGIKTNLAELKIVLQNREQLIQSLPEEIRKAVLEILQQSSSDTVLSKGLASLFQGQKNVADQLKNMAMVLDFAAVLNQEDHSDIQASLKNMIENFSEQSNVTSEQSSAKILDLAKMLSASSSLPQGTFKQTVEQLIRQTVPENMQQLSVSDQKNIVSLATSLKQSMPAEIQQLAQKNNIPNLPKVWALLQVTDVGQYADIEPQILQEASNIMKQLAKVIAPEKMTTATQLGQSISNLPSETGDIVTVLNQIEQFVKKIPNQSSVNATVVSQIEELMKNAPTEKSARATVVSQLEELVKSVLNGNNTKATVDSQIVELAKNLSTENNAKVTIVSQLEELVKNVLTGNITEETVDSQINQLAKNVSTEKSARATVVSQLEELVKSVLTGNNTKAAVDSQIVQLAKSLSTENNVKATVVSQLEELVKSLSTESNAKVSVVSQLEQFVKSLPADVGNKLTILTKLETFMTALPSEISEGVSQALAQENIPESLQNLSNKLNSALMLNKNMTNDQQAFLTKSVESLIKQSPVTPADISDALTQLANQFIETTTTTEQLKNLIRDLKAQLFTTDVSNIEKEQTMVNQLTKLFEEKIPQALQEGVVKNKLIDSAKVWTILKSLETEPWQNIESQSLQKSAGMIKELALSMYKSTGVEVQKQAEHSTLAFSIPLQVAEGVYYPAHIHIYQEQKNSSNELAQRQFETWLRICVDTENIGTVDSIFRLYGDNKLDVRVVFPSSVAASQFSEQLPALRKNLDESKINVADIMIGKIND